MCDLHLDQTNQDLYTETHRDLNTWDTPGSFHCVTHWDLWDTSKYLQCNSPGSLQCETHWDLYTIWLFETWSPSLRKWRREHMQTMYLVSISAANPPCISILAKKKSCITWDQSITNVKKRHTITVEWSMLNSWMWRAYCITKNKSPFSVISKTTLNAQSQ